MNWIGLTDHDEGRFAPGGLGPVKGNDVGDMLDRGTLMIETRVAGDDRPHDLLGLVHSFPWARELAFRAVPGGGIAMVHKNHDDLTHAAIRWLGDGRPQTLRISYAWDTSQGWARLSLEQPESTRVLHSTVTNPRPILTSDLRDITLGSGARTLSKEVLFVAAATDITPLGPMPSLHPGTPIATPTGYRAAGNLRRGDTVISDAGQIIPVLQTVRHAMPARGSFAPVRLHAPYFELGRDIVVAPEQRLVLKGSEVEYIFGQEAVLVPARHLVSGYAASWVAPQSVAEYVQLVLPGHEAIMAAGAALESLYIGRLRRKPDHLAASVLSDVPRGLLPEHARPIHQVLRPFEAITLIDQRAA
ncbi:Hint domain-containing protein [Tateyamaria sp.]|uniref:Hint domain-containing protein n=1 Tax=Tateyamaria sp. TaxID=1929288 RepID=UPI003B222B88